MAPLLDICHALDPVAFARERLNFQPDSKQALVLASRSKQVILNCTRQCHLPESETLIKELSNIRIKVSLAGHDTYGAWREGQHDDLVLAAALACWRGTKKEPPVIGTRPLF